MSFNEMVHNLSSFCRPESAVVAFERPFRRALPGYPAVKLFLVNAHSGAILSWKCEMDFSTQMAVCETEFGSQDE